MVKHLEKPKKLSTRVVTSAICIISVALVSTACSSSSTSTKSGSTSPTSLSSKDTRTPGNSEKALQELVKLFNYSASGTSTVSFTTTNPPLELSGNILFNSVSNFSIDLSDNYKTIVVDNVVYQLVGLSAQTPMAWYSTVTPGKNDPGYVPVASLASVASTTLAIPSPISIEANEVFIGIKVTKTSKGYKASYTNKIVQGSSAEKQSVVTTANYVVLKNAITEITAETLVDGVKYTSGKATLTYTAVPPAVAPPDAKPISEFSSPTPPIP